MFTNDRLPSKSQLHSYIEVCQSKLHSFARSSVPTKLRSQLGISDIVQETCLRAYQHLSSFQGRTHQQFVAWLRSILHHHLLNLYKRMHLRIDTQKLHQSQTIPVHCDESIFHEETPSHILMAREEQDIMNRALEQLTSDERYVLARHHRDQCTFAELGKELQCSEEAARKRWARALLHWQRLVQGCHA